MFLDVLYSKCWLCSCLSPLLYPQKSNSYCIVQYFLKSTKTSIVAIQAACAWHVRLSVHPDLPYNPLAFLQSLRALQLFGGGKHVTERPFKAPVTACWQIGGIVPVRIAVARVTGALRSLSCFPGCLFLPFAVGSTGDLHH